MEYPELEFKEYVEMTIRRYEFLFGPVEVDGEIDQFKEFTVTVHGKKETLVYTRDDMEDYYMSYLTQNAGNNRIEAVY